MTDIVETDDRWILPLRGSTVIRIEWPDHLIFELEPPGFIEVDEGAIFRKGPLKDVNQDPVRLRAYTKSDIDRMLGARILSSVGFKDGSLRIVFDNGWFLVVDSDDDEFAFASITHGESVIWKRSES